MVQRNSYGEYGLEVLRSKWDTDSKVVENDQGSKVHVKRSLPRPSEKTLETTIKQLANEGELHEENAACLPP